MIGTKFLQSHALFGGVSDEEIRMVRAYLEEARFAKGTQICTEGEPNDRLFFICEGSVSIVKRASAADDDPETIARLGAGDAFGEMELIDIQPCVATVTAEEDVTALTLSNRALYRIYKANLKTYAMIVLNMAREISRRLRRMDAVVATALEAQENDGKAIEP